MTVAVRYYSKGGKTKKLAETVAKVAGVEAKDISEPLTENVDVLFLCTAPYAFNVDPKVKEFIKNINVTVGKAAVVSSTALLKSIRKYVADDFLGKGIPLMKEEFCCRGEFLMFHKGKPDNADHQAAITFARRAIAHQ